MVFFLKPSDMMLLESHEAFQVCGFRDFQKHLGSLVNYVTTYYNLSDMCGLNSKA